MIYNCPICLENIKTELLIPSSLPVATEQDQPETAEIAYLALTKKTPITALSNCAASDDDDIVIFNCGHFLHHHCWERMQLNLLLHNNTHDSSATKCPVCREQVIYIARNPKWIFNKTVGAHLLRILSAAMKRTPSYKNDRLAKDYLERWRTTALLRRIHRESAYNDYANDFEEFGLMLHETQRERLI